MFSKFLLGKIVVSDGVRRALLRTPFDLVARHAVCDFGNATPRRVKLNLQSLMEGGEIQSVYAADPTDPSAGVITVTTSEGWGTTTVALIKAQPKTYKRKPTKKDDDDCLPI